MTEKAPVAPGERFVSMRSGEEGEVIDVRQLNDPRGWAAHMRMASHRIRWVTCSKDGIKGYRRKQ